MVEGKDSLFMEPDTHNKKDYEILKQLEEYFNNSEGTTTTKITNFTKYIRSQDLAKFLARYEIFKKIINVQGSIIECGVLFGGGLMAFAHFSALFEPISHSRKIIGFDTFSGFPELTKEDEGSTSKFAKKGDFAVDSFEDLKKCIALYDAHRYISHIPKVELIKGDVTKTIPQYLKENPQMLVSILYLDMDIYQPTKVALENFVPHMPKGSIIVFDELSSKHFPGESRALKDTIGVRNFKIEKFSFTNYQSYIVLE